MSRHHALLVIALTLIGGSGAAGAQDRPNIILIFSDDHALRAVSAYGDALIETPGVDRTAEEGMLFRHAMVTNSICGPSRAALAARNRPFGELSRDSDDWVRYTYQRYKLIHYYDLDEWELFDLDRDPNEMQSVYGDPEYRDVQAGMLERLGELREQYGDT